MFDTICFGFSCVRHLTFAPTDAGYTGIVVVYTGVCEYIIFMVVRMAYGVVIEKHTYHDLLYAGRCAKGSSH